MPRKEKLSYGSSGTSLENSLASSHADLRVPDRFVEENAQVEQVPLLVSALNGRGKPSRLPPMYVEKGVVMLRGCSQIPEEIRQQIEHVLSINGVTLTPVNGKEDVFSAPREVVGLDGQTINLAKLIGHITKFQTPKTIAQNEALLKRTVPIDVSRELDFNEINERANRFADLIEEKYNEVVNVLTRYETHEVAHDEIGRTLDLLRSLEENADYFQREIGQVAVFLPRNQPLYALACFGIIPSLMARDADVRAPVSMRKNDFFKDLADTINLLEHFPNINLSTADRKEFIEKHSQTNDDEHNTPVTDVVIVTGTPETSDRIRAQFPDQVLFITNGAGHNPIVVAKDGDLEKAIEGALTVGLYNQGEDCASPDSILVHEDKMEEFVSRLKEELAKVKVGPYDDPDVRVGPLQGPSDLADLQALVRKHIDWLDIDFGGDSNIRESQMSPTLIVKPLSEGANHQEMFGPVFVVQSYKDDKQLADYFSDPAYALNAMYITTYGNSGYVKHFIRDSKLHDASTHIENTHLHAEGVERGVEQYGGYGVGASHISIGGRNNPRPTLPQRDIHLILVEPNLKK